MLYFYSLPPDDSGLYTVDVRLSEKLITSYNKKIEFKQEMQGVAEIITEGLRLIERMFYQFKEILKKNKVNILLSSYTSTPITTSKQPL